MKISQTEIPDRIVEEIQISTVKYVFEQIKKNPQLTEREIIHNIENAFGWCDQGTYLDKEI